VTDDKPRIAVDIGGTFTDVVLEHGRKQHTIKVLTTRPDPGEGVLDGIDRVMTLAGLHPNEIGLIIHGTTLATNALIERSGAKTALITTKGHRDAVEMAQENRFEQYDINIDRPIPLVPRYLRLPAEERMDVNGNVLVPLNEDSVEEIITTLDQHEVESVAIGLLHAYVNSAHERRIAEILTEKRPALTLTLASEVCPEIREYERLSTACANAYVRPLMATYLQTLGHALKSQGFTCSFLLMTSGGGLTTLATAMRFPIRLVESGPAGGAILTAHIARECGIKDVLSFDMGGTTAKLCLIDEAEPLKSRAFEVDRAYRFRKGSGLPIRIPVIEMVEIGAGGGSIASVDKLGRIQMGPESAGSDPGPASYDQGGKLPTVTDSDVVLGKLVPDRFAGGNITLNIKKATEAVERDIGQPLGLATEMAAFGCSEIVDENMATAAHSHAVEWARDVAKRTMVAFGGAAPLHAVRLAEKIQVNQIIVPTAAGVGAAVGFLLAPIAYEVVRSRYVRLSEIDIEQVKRLFQDMREEATVVVRQGAPTQNFTEKREALMRFVGQGYEIPVPVDDIVLKPGGETHLLAAFEAVYVGLYGQTIPGQDVEIISWTLSLTVPNKVTARSVETISNGAKPSPIASQSMFDPGLSKSSQVPIYDRATLQPGDRIAGPALIAEDQTTTVVTEAYDLSVNSLGYLVLNRREKDPI